jgi:3-oxoacyl-[acyl-carrier-protein] synthase-1
MGIVSSIGNTTAEITQSLREGRSGIRRIPEYAELGFKCQVAGVPTLDWKPLVPRKPSRFMSEAIGWNYVAMDQAIKDAGLETADISNNRTGIIMGSGGPSTKAIVAAADLTRREKSPKKNGPFEVPKGMSSGPSGVLATAFQIKGVNFSVSSACATSAHCVGEAAEKILLGKQDVMFAGGCEEHDWTLSTLFDAMGAMSSKYNETPQRASRAYDKHRDGFVIAGGAGVLVLEEYRHARARGAKMYAELVGYGETSDGFDMVAPSGEGAVRCMRNALNGFGGVGTAPIDYINPHGTSTPVGDVKEIEAIREVFGNYVPDISATKSLSGHSLGAIGVQEAIFSILMMQGNFVAASANIEEIDPGCADVPIVRTYKEKRVSAVLSNSFGFGGTNASLVFTAI